MGFECIEFMFTVLSSATDLAIHSSIHRDNPAFGFARRNL